MQSGRQVHAITQQLVHRTFPPKSGHELPVKLTLPLSAEMPLASRTQRSTYMLLTLAFEDDGKGVTAPTYLMRSTSKKS